MELNFDINNPTTNTEMVAALMEYSKHGALAQAFVVEAITQHAEAVAKLTDEQVEKMQNPLINMRSWRAVAQEIKGKLDKFYSGDGEDHA